MKPLLALLLLASLSACTTVRRTETGRSAQAALADTAAKVTFVKQGTAAVQARTATASASARQAEVQAAQVAAMFVELRSAVAGVERVGPGGMEVARLKLTERQASATVTALQEQLGRTVRDIDLANTQAQIADFRAAEAEASATTAGQRVEALAQAEARQAHALAESQRQREEQRALAWKWRLLTAGSWALLAGFFVARQYLPFLKVL